MPKTVVENKDDNGRLISVSFPRGLLEEVDKVVNRKTPKYMSRADFCRAAVRMLLKEEKGIFPLSEKLD